MAVPAATTKRAHQTGALIAPKIFLSPRTYPPVDHRAMVEIVACHRPYADWSGPAFAHTVSHQSRVLSLGLARRRPGERSTATETSAVWMLVAARRTQTSV